MNLLFLQVLSARPAQSAPHPHDYQDEVLLSSCDYGCKVRRCQCGATAVVHQAVYGCRATVGIEPVGSAR